MQNSAASKVMDAVVASIMIVAPIAYACYHARHHMSVELDLVFFVCVSIVGSLALIQKTLSGILTKMSEPMTMKIIDKTVDMGDVDILIKSKE